MLANAVEAVIIFIRKCCKGSHCSVSINIGICFMFCCMNHYQCWLQRFGGVSKRVSLAIKLYLS